MMYDQTAVYRLYSPSRELLYVGVTNSPRHRFAQHAADKPWWSDVDERETDITWHPSRSSALRAERDLIRRHMPPHNIQHNPARHQRPAAPSSVGFQLAYAGAVSSGALIGNMLGLWEMPGWMTLASACVAGVSALIWMWRRSA